MGVRINSNDLLRPQNQLNQISKKLSKSNEKLVSGKRINKAYDDVVGLLKSASLTSAINEAQTNQNQSAQAQASLASSDATLFQNLEQLQSLRDLAVQASDDSVDSASRQVIVNQANEGLATITSDTPSVNLSTSVDARTSVSSLDSAIENVVSRLAASGSESQVLESKIKESQSKEENLAQARSLIEDTDFAAEISNNNNLQVQQAIAIKVLQGANEQKKKSVLNLIT